MRLDGYVRVSRVGGRSGDAFISPGEQKEKVRAWAKAHGHTIAKWHEDLDQPGSKSNRPGLIAAMDRIEAGKSQGLVVARLDRFGRSVQDSANLLARIRAADGVLCTVAESIDTSGYMGKFLADLFAALGELELARIRENWNAARKSAVARGIHVSGKVPTGYRRNAERILEPDPVTATIVHELFVQRGAEVSWAQLARFLEEKGVITPWDNENWTVASVASLVRNRVYLGEARAGSIVNPEAHEPIVSLAEWNAANRARGVAPGRSGRSTGVLAGILRCGGCSYAMKAKQSRTRHGKEFVEYTCKPDKAGGRCPAPASVKATVIEPFVTDRLFDFAKGAAGETTEEEGEEKRLTDALAAAEAELEATLDGRLADALGGANSDAFLRTVERRHATVESLREELAEVQSTRAPVALDIDLEEVWGDLDVEQRRRVLHSVLDSVFVWRTPGGGRKGKFPIERRTRLFLAGEGPPVPRRGQRGTIRTLPIAP
ncbi:MAG: site-specific recombinase [Solirubrobacterales bacterium]|jgi:DNA invertase Pin-like site-specific DNA recombinase|nr:site-specific recombinase [Solirubrobacterales bacterium]